MNYTTKEILQLENFKDFNRESLIEMINLLKNDLKYVVLLQDKDRKKLIETINLLNNDITNEKNKYNKLSEANILLRNKIIKKLSIWERIKGKIELDI